MHKASSVELRTSIEMAHSLAQIGIRFVPIPVETDEEASFALDCEALPWLIPMSERSLIISNNWRE